MTERRDTELAIRVKDYGTRTFKEVAASVNKITEALNTQVVAAERGDVSVGALRDTLKQLRDANRDLVKQQGALDFYQQLEAKLEAAQQKAASARAAFDSMSAAQRAGGEASKSQATQLGRLEKAANAAEAGVVRATARLEAQREKLEGLGIDTANLAAAQQNLVTVNAAVDRSLQTLTGAYENYDANLKRTRDAEKELQDAQRARQAADDGAKRRQDIAYQQSLTQAFEAQADAVDHVTAATKRRNAVEAGGQSTTDLAFLSRLEEALEQQKAAQLALAKSAELSGFQKIGDDALAAAGKIDVYAAAAARGAPASSRLAASIRSILDPGREAISTLAGLEAKVEEITKTIGDGKGSVHEYSEAIGDLDAVQRRIIQTAADVDVYRNQARVVSQAQQAFDEARAKVIAYANAVKTADEPNEELAASLRQAEAALDSAERELTQQLTKLKSYATELKKTGVEVVNLGDAEKRLAAVANQTAAATTKLADASSGKNGRIGRFLGLRPYELQNLAFQLNDVFTQIASGTSITQTFAQQGGQIVQLFPRMFSALIPLAPIILGVGLAVGVVAASLRQVFDLEDSQREFNALLTLSADGAQASAEALADTAHVLDVYGASLKDVRAEIKLFLKEGFDPSRIQAFGIIAQDVADVLKIKLPEAAKLLADGFTGGFEAIDKLDQELDFLSQTQREAIRLAFEQGDANQALTIAYEALRKKTSEAAAVSRDDLTVAVRNLTEAWDNLLHIVGNVLPISEAAQFIKFLTDKVRDLTDAIPRARAAAKEDAAAAGARKPPAVVEDPFKRQRQLRQFGPAGSIIGGILDATRTAGQRQRAEAAKAVKGVEAEAAKGGKILAETSERALKNNDRVLQGLREQFRHTKDLSAAERIRLSGLKAVQVATEKGATGQALVEARKIGEEYAKQEIAKENGRKAAAAGRKADAAARKAEAEENKRIALQQQLAGDLRQINARIERDQVDSLEDRLKVIDGQYVKIFETLEKLKKAGGKDVQGKSFADFTADVEEGKELLKQQETLKFFTEKIKALEDARVQRLATITDEVAAQQKTAQQGFKDAQAVVAELDPAIAAVAAEAVIFAEAIRGAKPDPKLEAFISRMERLRAAGGKNASRTNSPIAKVGEDLLGEHQSQLDKLVQTRDQVAANERELVELGLRTQDDAQARIRSAYAATNTEIAAQSKIILELAAQLREAGTITQIEFEGIATKLQIVRQQAQFLDERFVQLKSTIVDGLVQGFTSLVSTAAQGIAGLISGTVSWKDALDSVEGAARNFIASFLQGIAEVLLQIAILQAIKSLPFLDSLTNSILSFAGLSAAATALAAPAGVLTAAATGLNTAAPLLAGPAAALATAGGALNLAGPLLAAAAGPLGAVAAALMAAAIQMQVAASLQLAANATGGVLHSGGVVGQGFNRTRSVSASLFAAAPRYHSGTVVGLKPREHAAILEENEEVLSKDDPRNILNGGAAATGNMASQLMAALAKLKMNVKVVNAIDSGDMLSSALNTTQGERSVLNFIRNRSAAVGGILGTNGRRG